MTILSLNRFFERARLPESHRKQFRNFNFGMCGREAPPSVRELALSLGFDIAEVQMRQKDRGRLVRDPFSRNGYLIEVNQSDDVCTRRWTVLHEIAHAYLHQSDNLLAGPKYRAGFVHFYDEEERREEREANLVVEAIVFGEGALDGAIGLYGRDERSLCRHFGVNPMPLNIALQKLP
ncbi:ImmA/IrrE family metallo-endopeptidase [Rhodobacteraceae bacterium 2376]|uniref:ImmA/IrrE family metallo-endopeptidase n=1 Tax=Rhabdonatronobacter sediminivivens TaxID=2743469 RepID=A0A7Z0KZ31_9RHOB|nr:ImmA/IrrE family metallo-endopeptidase [Rhabdonatronobacter sediminivivens]NYS25820.1 ImmA/IrrE family metallo-endopeptidase [Rhabdonatronobacter sediminivivens]